jgi:hypothetical protein
MIRQSKVIKVDFLQKSTPEQKLVILKAQLEKLEKQEKILIQETNEVIKKAKRVISSK